MMRGCFVLVAVGQLAACKTQAEPTTTLPPPTIGLTEDSTVITDTGETTVVEPTGSTASIATTADTGEEPFDCSAPWPAEPAPFMTLKGFSRAEDFDLDLSGYAGSINNKNLTGRDQAGNIKVIATNISNSTAGTRLLATGDWVVADVAHGTLVLVDTATGGKTTLATNFSYPNGVETDHDNNVYVADQTKKHIRRVNAYTGDDIIIAKGLKQPNGVILSPDEQTLYVGSFGGGVVYAIDRLGPDSWDTPRILFDPPGPDGGFDGINVDMCGNVYVTEYIAGKVYRIRPDGSAAQELVKLPSSWIPNLRWGHDIGGWSSDLLYVADRNKGRIFGIETGIPGKKHVALP